MPGARQVDIPLFKVVWIAKSNVRLVIPKACSACYLIPIFSGIEIWHYLLAACAPVSMSTCEAYFLFEAATFQLLQLCLDAVLILRSKSSELSILNSGFH